VEPHRTTAAQLIEWFGPPDTIARPSAAPEAPAEASAGGDQGAPPPPGDERSAAVLIAPWFEPFAARQPIRHTHRVYYWSCTTRGGYMLYLFVGVSNRSVSTRELWVLVDEETGLAEGALFREQ
jgi:hypothetical protein